MIFNSPKSRLNSTSSTTQNPPLALRQKSKSSYDRHIRRIDSQQFSIRSPSPSSSEKSSSSYHSQLQESLFKRKGIRQYTLQKRQRKEQRQTPNLQVNRGNKPVRKFRVPGWTDNYYASLLDWSYTNFICAANANFLYFYNMALDNDFENALYRQYTVKSGNQKINAIHFSPTLTKIVLGYTEGSINFFDYFKQKTNACFFQHCQRITTIEWYDNTIYTGSKDKDLKALDYRTLKTCLLFPDDHRQEICGVKAYASYLASGGNDNNVFIYDIRRPDHYLYHYRHEAAVKALDWVMPNVLVSGGGTTDRRIKFWKDGEGVFKSIDTGSQVCGLIASTNSPELVSCQGFSLNQIIIWNMYGKRELTVHGHQSRVLYSTMSPGGRFVATGAGDQLVQVWKFFDSSRRDWPPSDIR